MSVADAATTSLWFDQVGPIRKRPSLQGDVDVDVAIVGGGYSGLWTAYYLRQIDPTLRIQIIEKHYCGYGASGRNDGWAVGDLAGSFASYAKRSSPQEALRQARAVFDSVDEIGRVADAAGIDCDYRKGGWIRVARNGTVALFGRQARSLSAKPTRGSDCFGEFFECRHDSEVLVWGVGAEFVVAAS